MRHPNSIISKTLVLFCSTIIPVIIIALVSCIVLTNRTKADVERRTVNYHETNIMKIDTDIQQIYLSNASLLQQLDVQRLTGKTSHSREYEIVNHVRQSLSNIQSLNPYIESAHLYSFNRGRMYNSSGYRMGSFCQISHTDYKNMLDAALSSGWLTYYKNPLFGDQRLSIFIVPIGSNPEFFIEFILSETYLEKQFSLIDENEQFLLEMHEGHLISNMDSSIEDSILSDKESFPCGEIKKISLAGHKEHIMRYNLPNTSGEYFCRISESYLEPVKNNFSFLALICAIVIACSAAFFLIAYKLIQIPFRQMSVVFESIENENFGVQLETDEISDDFLALYNSFNKMSQKLSDLIENNLKLEILVQKAELKQLQAQVNPHFLYNSFFILQRMIEAERTDEASQYAYALGHFFKYVTPKEADLTSLKDEYEYAKNYAEIQKLRFAGQVSTDIPELDPAYEKITVPKLILQPIIENAFNYGISGKVPFGIIRVSVTPLQPDGTFSIIFEDNGDMLTDDALRSLQGNIEAIDGMDINMMSGLMSICKRLKLFYGIEKPLVLSRSELGGLKVSVDLVSNASKHKTQTEMKYE